MLKNISILIIILLLSNVMCPAQNKNISEDKKIKEDTGLFLNSEHKELFEEYIKRDKVREQDRERKALFFILSGCPDLINIDIDKIYDFREHCLIINPEIEEDINQFALSSSSGALLLLACNLYNNRNKSLSVSDTFSNLDEGNFKLALNSIKIRFDRNLKI